MGGAEDTAGKDWITEREKYNMVKQKKHSKDLLETISRKYGVTAEEVRKDMEFAITSASSAPDPEEKGNFKKRFGEGTPTPEEFIYIMVKAVKESMSETPV